MATSARLPNPAPGAKPLSVAGISPDPETLWQRLKAASPDLWAGYLANEFVWALAEGTLPEKTFRHYIVQDYLYCLHYSRVLAFGAFKGESAADMQKTARKVLGVLDVELALHRELLDEWGIPMSRLDEVPEAMESIAYTRYLFDICLKGDALEYHTALAPCVLGYAEVGTMLAASPRTRHAGNPYALWIENYTSDEFAGVVDAASEHLESLARERLTEERFPRLVEIFAQTLRLDIAFWNMAQRGEA